MSCSCSFLSGLTTAVSIIPNLLLPIPLLHTPLKMTYHPSFANKHTLSRLRALPSGPVPANHSTLHIYNKHHLYLFSGLIHRPCRVSPVTVRNEGSDPTSIMQNAVTTQSLKKLISCLIQGGGGRHVPYFCRTHKQGFDELQSRSHGGHMDIRVRWL